MWFYTRLLARGTSLRAAFCPYGRPSADRGARSRVNCHWNFEIPQPQISGRNGWKSRGKGAACGVPTAHRGTKQSGALSAFLRKTKLIDKTQATITYTKSCLRRILTVLTHFATIFKYCPCRYWTGITATMKTVKSPKWFYSQDCQTVPLHAFIFVHIVFNVSFNWLAFILDVCFLCVGVINIFRYKSIYVCKLLYKDKCKIFSF